MLQIIPLINNLVVLLEESTCHVLRIPSVLFYYYYYFIIPALILLVRYRILIEKRYGIFT